MLFYWTTIPEWSYCVFTLVFIGVSLMVSWWIIKHILSRSYPGSPSRHRCSPAGCNEGSFKHTHRNRQLASLQMCIFYIKINQSINQEHSPCMPNRFPQLQTYPPTIGSNSIMSSNEGLTFTSFLKRTNGKGRCTMLWLLLEPL